MSDPIVQFLLRVPASVKVKVEEAAKKNNRSANAEALARLEESLSHAEQSNQQIADLTERLDSMDTAYRQTMAHYDRILKLIEQHVDFSSLTVKKD